MVLIMCTPIKNFYCNRNQWEICATKFKGTIYFSAIDSDVDIAEEDNASIRKLKLQSWGYKFEQYMTTDKMDGEPDLSSNTHQLEEYCIVLKNVINKHSLIYKAEIDAVIPYRQPTPGNGDTSCYTELKTAKISRTTSEIFFSSSNKLPIWWAQSYLAGVPEIICGRRNDEGIVKSIEILKVSSLPQQGLGIWSAEACINFCDKFLNFLKKTVVEDDPSIVYKFHYQGKETIHCTKLVNPTSRYIVIPNWYQDAFKE